MSSEKFFIDNLNRLTKGLGGQPQDPEKHNLYWGLLNLSREIGELRREQQQVLQELRQLASRIR